MNIYRIPFLSLPSVIFPGFEIHLHFLSSLTSTPKIFVCLFVCLFVYLFVCLFVCLFVYLFVYLFVCLFVCLFICLFVCLLYIIFCLPVLQNLAVG